MSKKMPSICFIVPFFDEKKTLAFLRKKRLPTYFDYFLGTFGYNKSISLKIFTNASPQRYLDYCSGTSISFHHMSLMNIFKLFQQKLQISGFTSQDFRAYKICDYKPMFGLVFSEYLKGYDYWGYCDVDMIIGNLEKFLSSENIGEAEMVSGTSILSGYMTLYKNIDSMNYLFTKSPDYLKVINSPKNIIFDEGGKEGIVAMQQVIEREQVDCKKISFVHNDCGTNNRERDWDYFWNNGKLTDELSNKEIGAFHFVTSKRDPKFIIKDFDKTRPFHITREGFSFLP